MYSETEISSPTSGTQENNEASLQFCHHNNNDYGGSFWVWESVVSPSRYCIANILSLAKL